MTTLEPIRIAVLIRLYRKREGMTIPQLAAVIGVKSGLLFRFETGRTIALKHAVKIIAWALCGKFQSTPFS